jgi:hypothetical protein
MQDERGMTVVDAGTQLLKQTHSQSCLDFAGAFVDEDALRKTLGDEVTPPMKGLYDDDI